MSLFGGGAGRKGLALIMAVFSLLILGVLAAGFMANSISEHRMSFNEYEATAAVQLADAGISYAYQWLNNQDPAPCQAGGEIDLGSMDVGLTAPFGTAHPTVYASPGNDCSDGGFDCSGYGGDDKSWKYTVHSDGTAPDGTNAAIEIDVVISYDTGPCYALFFDNCNAWFWDYDVVKGPAHTNGQFMILNANPPPWTGCRFWGRVTQWHNEFRMGGTPDCAGDLPECYATFYQGYETGVDKIDYPPDFSDIVVGIDPAYRWDEEVWIELQPDGTMDVDMDGWGVGAGPVNMALPNNGVCWVRFTAGKGDAHVKGTLNGRLSIVAGRHIIIEDDILYLDDPRFTANSQHMLGLVASFKRDGNIVIPDVNPGGADGDRQIFAYLVALRSDGHVQVLDWDHRHREGTLYTYGSWILGMIRATENSSATTGYGTETEHDERGCLCPPPKFPPLEVHNQPLTKVAQADTSWREVF